MASSTVFQAVPCCPVFEPFFLSPEEEDDGESSIQDKLPVSPQSQADLKTEPQEAMGWTLDAAARGVTIMGAAVFVNSALLKLAKEAAGCDEWIEEETCKGRVYGMRPSSLLTNIVMISGLVSASMMPLVGSIVDHTPYRRAMGRYSALALTLLVFVQIILLKRVLWFAAAFLQVLVAFAYSVHLCASFAYLPELSTDKAKLAKYTARFTAAQYSASAIFLTGMIIILIVLGIGEGQEVAAARLSQSVVFHVCIIFFGIAWTKFFRERPASQAVPEGSTVASAGFRRLIHTSQRILTHHGSVKWFLVAVAFADSAAATFSSIAITYMTDQLGFSPSETGICILLLLIFAVPGTKVAAMLTRRFDPVRSLQCCLVVWIINTGFAALVLRGAGQQMTAYGFAVVWGISIGWQYPSEKTLYCSIIPVGQEAEMMGLYIFASQILAWLPPLVFTLLNEAGFSMQLGLFSLNIYFAISLVVMTLLFGGYDEAIHHTGSFDVTDHDVSGLHNAEETDDYRILT